MKPKKYEKEVFVINTAKKILIHLKTSIKFIVMIAVAIFIIIACVFMFYKPIYSVTLEGEFIGYCSNKFAMQARINDYLDGSNEENENVAFIKVDKMPEYKICLLKKNIETSDDDIFSKVTSTSTTYFKFFAITNDGEEKYNVKTFEEAEAVVEKLKEKQSTNSDKIGIVEKYEVELKEFANVDDCVKGLYVKKKVSYYASSYSSPYSSGVSSGITKLGISFINPTSGIITSRYGPRSRDNHAGIDIAASSGTPIYAAAGGIVVHASNTGNGYGNYIIIDHGNGIETYYAHCRSLSVVVGQTVSQGEYIAAMGTTGISTGNHLHFEIRQYNRTIDPQQYTY